MDSPHAQDCDLREDSHRNGLDRRKFIKYLVVAGVSLVAAKYLSGCSPVETVAPTATTTPSKTPTPTPGQQLSWKQRLDTLLVRDGLVKKDHNAATPYLVLGDVQYGWDPATAGVISILKDMNITLQNQGNAPSYSTFVELYKVISAPLYQGQPNPRFNDLEMIYHRVLTIQSGQELSVQMGSHTLGDFPKYHEFYVVCYDPVFDPRGFPKEIELSTDNLATNNRHIRRYS